MNKKFALRQLFQIYKDPRVYVKTLSMCALLAAAGVVLDFFGINIPMFGASKGIALNLGLVPVILSGMLFGPIWGGMVGAVQDLAGVLLKGDGTPFLGFTLTVFCVGFFAGLFAYFFPKLSEKWYGLACFCVFIALFSNITNSFWLTFLVPGKTFMAFAVTRLISVPFSAVAYTLVLYIVYKKVFLPLPFFNYRKVS